MGILKTTFLFSLLLGFMASTIPAWAKDDSSRARALLEKGEILSLTEILKKVSQKVPGKILEVALEEKQGQIVYEIEFLGEDGVVMEMLIDAKTARIISVGVD